MIKILVVEDEKSLRDVLGKKLEKESFEVILASNGAEGIEAFKKEKPDLILLDILMPQKNGFEVIKEIREIEESDNISNDKKVPIILLTNLSEQEGMGEAQKMGIFDYLDKSNWTLDGVTKKVRDKLGLNQ